MAPVKFQRVVSFSSEDPNQPAENLIKDGTYRKWRCKQCGEQKAWVELQLENTSCISAVDIGNHGSAFIEVLVGRSGCSENEYKVLLNSASFMTPQECRNETNLQRVRIFKYQDLNKSTQTEKWDRVKVVCTQPFNKQLQYGISFITIHAPEEESTKTKVVQDSAIRNVDLGMFKFKEEATTDPIKQGSLFSRFKLAQSVCTSPNTQPGAIRAASQSLASIALAQSEQEAMNILRKTPQKDGRPDIKLTEKLKISQSQSPITKTVAKPEEQPLLSSRKEVDTDRPRQIIQRTTPARESPVRKKDEKKIKIKSPYNGVKQEEALKRKTTSPPTHSDDTNRLAKKQRKTKPFRRLLEGVVVVLSGFQNPLRSQLRDKLVALGATYKPEWNASCTHLICAFYNTPKFREVKGKGKIVTKNWVEDCYAQRKRLPWRRYCLDKNDRKEESEEEIWTGDEEESSPVCKPNSSKGASNSASTPVSVATAVAVPTVHANSKTSLVEPEEDYGGSTEVDEVDTDDEIDMIKKKIHEQQACANNLQETNIFAGSNFFLGEDLSDDVKKEITRCVTELKGHISSKLKSKVEYFITDNPDESSILKANSKNKDIKIIKSDWVRECEKLGTLISPEQFMIAMQSQ